MQVFGNCTHFHLQFFSSINLFCLFLVYFAAEAAHEGTELAIVVLLAREPPEEDLLRPPVVLLHKVREVVLQQLAQVHVEVSPADGRITKLEFHMEKTHFFSFGNTEMWWSLRRCGGL